MPTIPRLFCFGLGYTAGLLADAVASEGWSVAGTGRTAREGRNGPLFRFERRAPLDDPGGALGDTTHILLSIPPEADGDAALAVHGPHIAALVPTLRWIGYLSTSGVYGDHGGAWVDEETPPQPTGERSRRRLDAENAWRDFGRAHGIPVQVFRLPGIYGRSSRASMWTTSSPRCAPRWTGRVAAPSTTWPTTCRHRRTR